MDTLILCLILILPNLALIAALFWTNWAYRRTINRLLEHSVSLDLRLRASLSVAAPFMAMIAGAETADHSCVAIDQTTTNRLHRDYFFARTGKLMSEEV